MSSVEMIRQASRDRMPREVEQILFLLGRGRQALDSSSSIPRNTRVGHPLRPGD